LTGPEKANIISPVAINGGILCKERETDVDSFSSTTGDRPNTKEVRRVKKALGTHFLLELFDCKPATLTSIDFVKDTMIRAANSAHANIVDTFFHQFKPYGVSGVVIVEESHLSIHTWPEYGYAAVDLFFCSDDVLPENAKEVLRSAFDPKEMRDIVVQRGLREARVNSELTPSCPACAP
jgi:S-adenosylmethionine decarboxylase proenzyme